MTQDDDTVPYQQLVDHFNRPSDSPGEQFDPDELPEGEPRELYDTVMAEYYSHIPSFTATSAKEKAKFDLINRANQNIEALAAKAQAVNSNVPEVLETTENKQLTRQEIKRIVGSYRSVRPVRPREVHP
ncbi:MAG: hypothetical protein JWO07_25 [Candidatus Saccharibacteria bacterium]|nr:hypothetical protein [Candidatus Saccharibacteria bacterium]